MHFVLPLTLKQSFFSSVHILLPHLHAPEDKTGSVFQTRSGAISVNQALGWL